jgi:RNA polymerase sigma-70 factor (ECF subfamily)
VLRYALRRTDPHTAEDVVSETLLVIWRRIDEIPVGAESAWAYGVAQRQLANAARSERRHNALIARIIRLKRPAAEGLPADLPDPHVHRALARLRPADQELLRLSAWDGLTASEIAAVHKVSSNAISIRLHRARQRFAASLTLLDQDAGRQTIRDSEAPSPPRTGDADD